MERILLFSFSVVKKMNKSRGILTYSSAKIFSEKKNKNMDFDFLFVEKKRKEKNYKNFN